MSRQTPQANPARSRRRVGVRGQGKKTPNRHTENPAKDETPLQSSPIADAELEAQRALLADPAAIAAGTARPPVPRRRTIPTIDDAPAMRAPEKRAPDSTPDSSAAPPQRARALLDVTRAQRLAREARLRERASREALARSREALGTAEQKKLEAPRETQPVAEPGWQRRALVQKAEPAVLPSAERALAAELREARATLAIARETTQIQRDEITRLRTALAAAEATPSARTPRSPAPSSSEGNPLEQANLRGRIAELESELERAALALADLHRTLAAHQQELVERNRRIAALQDRFDAQEQAFEQTRRQAEQERRRHTDAQTLLERLRATLRGVEIEPGARGSALAPPAPEPLDLSPVPSSSATSTRAPIFELWREEQVRRNFGPLGVDSTADLLRAPLARRARRDASPLPILLVGRGVGAQARDLAESLVQAGSPSFVLHYADPADALALAEREDDSLRGMLERCSYPDRPEVLRKLVDDLAPAAIVAKDFLTWQPDLDAWLVELHRANASGTCLVLLEETGLGAVTPSSELAAIGERIWELMPERYTRSPITGAPVASFGEAFAARETPPRNELLRRLREGFELELCAQFGFLAEAFVNGPIAGCFDPTHPRDQRFLKQIADVDERRLESGSAAALHLIARIDPAAVG